MSSGVLDLPHVGWRVHWVVESEVDSVNPPHDWGLSDFLLPWGEDFVESDPWEEKKGETFGNPVNDGVDSKAVNSVEDCDPIKQVNPEHGEKTVGFLIFPVVVSGGLINAVVKFLLIDFIEIELEETTSCDSPEKVNWEENNEPEGRSSRCVLLNSKEIIVSGVDISIVIQMAKTVNSKVTSSIQDPDKFIKETQFFEFSANNLHEESPSV